VCHHEFCSQGHFAAYDSTEVLTGSVFASVFCEHYSRVYYN
jgi:hypothetical protein